MKKTCYIIFQSKNIDTPWWLKFLDKNFVHCWVIEKQYFTDDTPFYIGIDNLLDEIDILAYSGGEISEVLQAFGEKDDKCIEITVDCDEEKYYPRFNILSCVSIVKKQLGINKFFIFTPKQLYKYLLKIGGKEIEWELPAVKKES